MEDEGGVRTMRWLVLAAVLVALILTGCYYHYYRAPRGGYGERMKPTGEQEIGHEYERHEGPWQPVLE